MVYNFITFVQIERIMKNLFLFITIVIVTASCSKDNVKSFRIDPNSKVYVKPQTTIKAVGFTKAGDQALSPLDVVKKATTLRGFNSKIADSEVTWMWAGKDTTSATPALLRMASDIIYDTDGYGHYGLQMEFIETRDFVITSGSYPVYDTLAYIPNANITSARQQIIAAFEAKDTAAVYEIFYNAFRFIPITASAYRDLKRQGLQ